MKRYGNLWSKICERSNIEDAARKALKGKPLTRDRRKLIENWDESIDKIQVSLNDQTYQFGELYSFLVHEPKEREIHCPHFYPDRVLHHCLMNVLSPLFYEKFISNTFGSINGRGVALAAAKVKDAIKSHKDWYFLQIDVRQFYHSIDHDVMKNLIRRVIKCKQTIEMCDRIIDVHSPGLAIGVYPSQYFANLYLSPIDHWAKEVARVKHYYRYMDDMLFIVPDKHSAHQILSQLTIEIEKIGLTIKNNVRIAPFWVGIDFIGYKFFPTHTLLRKRIKLKMQRTLRRLRKRNATDEEIKRKTASHFGWCKHADCRNLLRSTFEDKIYLYKNQMEIKRLSDIKELKNWFGLGKDRRVSIESLFGIEIAFFEHIITPIKGENKIIIKFAYPDNTDEFYYFITRSDVIMDRIEKDKELMPFLATIKKVKNYTSYE